MDEAEAVWRDPRLQGKLRRGVTDLIDIGDAMAKLEGIGMSKRMRFVVAFRCIAGSQDPEGNIWEPLTIATMYCSAGMRPQEAPEAALVTLKAALKCKASVALVASTLNFTVASDRMLRGHAKELRKAGIPLVRLTAKCGGLSLVASYRMLRSGKLTYRDTFQLLSEYTRCPAWKG